MAVVKKATPILTNPGQRRRRKLTPKQIKHFGTKAQKAALKRKRSAGHAARGKRTKRVAATVPIRKNSGEIISLGLAAIAGNPGTRKGKKKMAAKKSRRRAGGTRRRRTQRRRAQTRALAPVRSNPGTRRRRSHSVTHRRRRSYRRNPGMRSGSVSTMLVSSLWVIGGAVGARMLVQFALGEKNTGIMGYGAVGPWRRLRWACWWAVGSRIRKPAPW
ncbi:MAG: hypothetical protein IPK75_20245 [Acidobacteria bacterium]|nr:hypothetical protein [Acidobacteriota bacterium]